MAEACRFALPEWSRIGYKVAMGAPTSIGTSDFLLLRSEGLLYVDKTAFVSRVLTGAGRVQLYCRPRRFGKTLNLSTLRYFVERSGPDRSALFQGLSVWADDRARKDFQRHPVIWLSFLLRLR